MMVKKIKCGRLFLFGVAIITHFSVQGRELVRKIDLTQSTSSVVTSTSLELSSPQFGNLKGYQKLYSGNSLAPGIQQMSYPWDFMEKRLLLGWGGGVSFFSGTGKTGRATDGSSNPDPETLEVSMDPTTLIYLPINIALGGQFSLFSDNSYVFQFIGAYQESFYEEVRRPSEDSKEEEIEYYINRGWGNYLLFRFSLDISLNRVDPQSILSLYKSFGVNNVYLSPFLALSSSLGTSAGIFVREESKVDFGGTTMGVGIRFETR